MVSDPFQLSASPTPLRKSESPPPRRKRKLVDLRVLSHRENCQVGDIFGYKNKVFMKIVFKPVLRSAYHRGFNRRQLQNRATDESSGEFRPFQP